MMNWAKTDALRIMSYRGKDNMIRTVEIVSVQDETLTLCPYPNGQPDDIYQLAGLDRRTQKPGKLEREGDWRFLTKEEIRSLRK